MKINSFITGPFMLKCCQSVVPFVTLRAEKLRLLNLACAVCVVADWWAGVGQMPIIGSWVGIPWWVKWQYLLY